MVLEARERVGGRVYTHHGDGFTAPVDLGASIITGTQPSVEKGLRADPSAQVARCVGWGPSVWMSGAAERHLCVGWAVKISTKAAGISQTGLTRSTAWSAPAAASHTGCICQEWC